MRVTVIAARELRDEDAALWSRMQAANAALVSPYFCPGFTRAVGAVRDDARVAILEDAAEIVGYFPFEIGRMKRGRPIGGPLSDYQGVICARNDGWDVPALIRGAGMNSWDFDHLLCEQTPFQPHVVATAESPVMDLSRGFDEYVEARRAAGSKLLQKLATSVRKIERDLAPIRFEATSKDPAILHQVLAWKSAQCIASGGIDAFAVGWTRELVERLLHTQEGDGFGGMLSVLYAGDRILAAHFGMRSSTVWHYWFPTYNHEFSSFSPGLMLLLDMARSAESLGLRTIDLGKGDSQYKERTRSRGIPIAEGRIEIPSMAVRLRRVRERTETWIKSSPIAGPARVPGRALKRFERWMRFR